MLNEDSIKAKVLFKHSLWGEQGFETEALHIIDDDRVGGNT